MTGRLAGCSTIEPGAVRVDTNGNTVDSRPERVFTTNMTTTKTQNTPRYIVRRSLSYAHTFYGAMDDLDAARSLANRQTVLGYPSQIIDTSAVCSECGGCGSVPAPHGDLWVCRPCAGTGQGVVQ